jgi:hypothetical protein
MNKLLLIFFIIILQISCSNRVPHDVIPQGQMMKIMWQMSVTDGVYQSDTSRLTRTHLKDSLTAAYAHILKDNKASLTTYQTSLKYYESQPELMKELVDTTLKYGTKIKDSFAKHYTPVYHPVNPPVNHPPLFHPAPQLHPTINKNFQKPLLPHVFPHQQSQKSLTQ